MCTHTTRLNLLPVHQRKALLDLAADLSGIGDACM